MNFYNNIFASTYKYYSRFDNESPRYSAAIVVTVCQILFFLLLIQLLKMANIVDVIGVLPNKYYFLPVLIIWVLLQFRYYTTARANAIVERFEQKTLLERRAWAFLSLFSFIGVGIILAVLLSR